MSETYFCSSERRRILVSQSASWNGIEYLEVIDTDLRGIAEDYRQRVLLVHCLKTIANAGSWGPGRFRIDGGVRIRGIKVVTAGVLSVFNPATLPLAAQPYFQALVAGAGAANTFIVITDARGDFSDYTLSLQNSPGDPTIPAGFDVMLAAVTFRFKVECPSDFDCKPVVDCTTPRTEPALDYLAKDFNSFRRLMLDRLSTLQPDWTERNPADLQIALVETLAYVGDQLSYYQDFAATEAYLPTSRSRISVRRHSRLLDYWMHDGAAARAWVAFEVSQNVTLNAGTMILSKVELGGTTVPASLSTAQFSRLPSPPALVFETMEKKSLTKARNKVSFYTWGDEDCCLPKGSTSATLADVAPGLNLAPGDVLIIEEVINPKTGEPAGADRAKRVAVRLTSVQAGFDHLTTPPTPVVSITWHDEDALPTPLCLFVTVQTAAGSTKAVPDVSVVRANVVLADHGERLHAVLDDPTVDQSELSPAGIDPASPEPGRLFRPLILEGPVSQVCLPPKAMESAAASGQTDPLSALPAIEISEYVPTGTPGQYEFASHWEPARDLLALQSMAANFVVEVESDGSARVRFGDGIHGRVPREDAVLVASYRVGNGSGGNAGAEVLVHCVTDLAGITKVRNPLPARGGTDIEPMQRVQLVAPQAFRTQLRAVTEADYAAVTEKYPGVHAALAKFIWTGSWHTVFITVDRLGGAALDGNFKAGLLAWLDRFRMAGHDIELRDPKYVALDLEMQVCVKVGYFRSNVELALLDRFTNDYRSNGDPGFFHPDNFTFGQPVYLSQVFEAALGVPGVDSVSVTVFQRYGQLPAGELFAGVITALPDEILRLDNDPNFPENGRLVFDLQGGL